MTHPPESAPAAPGGARRPDRTGRERSVPHTESPAEILAGELALSISEGRGLLPAPKDIAARYRVRLSVAVAALDRLERAGISSRQPDGGAVAVGGPSPVLDVTAAAAMCRHLAPLLVGDRAVALAELRRRLLFAGRRALREPLTSRDDALAVGAREILQLGRDIRRAEAERPQDPARPAQPPYGQAGTATQPRHDKNAPVTAGQAGSGQPSGFARLDDPALLVGRAVIRDELQRTPPGTLHAGLTALYDLATQELSARQAAWRPAVPREPEEEHGRDL